MFSSIFLLQIYSRSSEYLYVHSLSIVFQSVFLPQGYPDSVSDDYLTYQIWDTVQVTTSLPPRPYLNVILCG